jgi:D-methionine transport system substrate-binding protein
MKIALATLAATLCLLSAPGVRAAEPRDVAIAVFPGPYAELVRRGIKPGLEAKGYRVTVRETADPVGLYTDVVEGRIQASLGHDARYLRQFASLVGGGLSPAVAVPTLGTALYSRRVKSVAELKAGEVVVVARDSKYRGRQLRFLEELGLVTVRRGAAPTPGQVDDPSQDIAASPRGLEFRFVWLHEAAAALDTAAAVVVEGDSLLGRPVQLPPPIAVDPAPRFLKVIAIRTADREKPFVKDLQAVVQGPGFRQVVDDPKGGFSGWARPDWMR